MIKAYRTPCSCLVARKTQSTKQFYFAYLQCLHKKASKMHIRIQLYGEFMLKQARSREDIYICRSKWFGCFLIHRKNHSRITGGFEVMAEQEAESRLCASDEEYNQWPSCLCCLLLEEQNELSKPSLGMTKNQHPGTQRTL